MAITTNSSRNTKINDRACPCQMHYLQRFDDIPRSAVTTRRKSIIVTIVLLTFISRTACHTKNLVAISVNGVVKPRFCASMTPTSSELPEKPTMEADAYFLPLVYINDKQCPPHFDEVTEEHVLLIAHHVDCNETQIIGEIYKNIPSALSVIMYDEDRLYTQELSYLNYSGLSVFSMRRSDAKDLRQYQNISIHDFTMRRRVDPSMIFLLIMVILTALAGSYWAGSTFTIKQKRISRSIKNANIFNQASGSVPVRTRNALNKGRRSSNWSIGHVVTVFIMSSLVVILTYFFLTVMTYVILTLTCCCGLLSLNSCLTRMMNTIHFFNKRRQICKIYKWEVDAALLISMPLSLVIVTGWIVVRKSSHAWILQNFIVIAICVKIIADVRVGGINVIVYTMIMFFLFDIFFVFVTPHILLFKKQLPSPMDHQRMYYKLSGFVWEPAAGLAKRSADELPVSVMGFVKFGITSFEQLPVALQIRSSLEPPMPCAKSIVVSIGVGEIVLPGLLITYCRLLDLRCPGGCYHIISLGGYATGLLLAVILTELRRVEHPMLLYIVPCVCVPVMINARIRKEIKQVYSGHILTSPHIETI